MTLTFYYAPQSTATVTELVIEELGIPHERVKLDIRAKATQTAEFLALNPNGKVPTIVHDGTPIWESAAITIYLGETFGADKQLWPPAGPQRGEAIKWTVWTNVTLGDAVYRVGRNTGTWVPVEQQNAKVAELAAEEVQKLLGILDQALAGKSYLTGDHYTLADAHVNSFLDWLRYQKVPMASFSHLNAWAERCMARPAYKKVNAHP